MVWFFVAWRETTRVFYNLLYKIEFRGQANIPKTGGYIIACNHLHYFDPIFLSFRISHTIRYLGKAELFKNFWVGWIFRCLGTICVDRGAGDSSIMEDCGEVINKGEVLGIFPEGTRSRDGAPGRPKSGMSVIAKLTKADILPCGIISERPLSFRSKIIVTYGQVIPNGELGLTDESPRALKKATKQVWGEILKLAGVEAQHEED